MLTTKLFDFAITCLSMLPLIWLQKIGSLLGLILWYAKGRMARVTMENIKLCFLTMPPDDQIRLARSSLVHTGKTTLETIFMWKASREACLSKITAIENEEVVSTALASSKGLVFIIPHLGNWELINHYLGSKYGLTHMSLPFRDTGINDLISRYRARSGTKFVEASQTGIKAQLRVLRSGGAVGAMPDQEPAVHTGSFATFFGNDALTSELVSGYVNKTGAKTVLAYCQRDGADFLVKFHDIDMAGDLTQTMTRAIENAILEVPEQYLWSYKRFRTRKAGEPERYQLPQGVIRRTLEHITVRLFLHLTRWFRAGVRALVAPPIAKLMILLNLKPAHVSRVNIALCFPEKSDEQRKELLNSALTEFTKTGLELGSIWNSSVNQFSQSYLSVEGLEHMSDGATLVLTPPLGAREMVFGYLGQHYHCTEYYHHAPSTAIDNLIREQRTRMGVALVEHDSKGVATLQREFTRGHVVALCPDQQPRLRTGEFIPFFGVPALTATVLAELLQEHAPQLVFGISIREGHRFRIHFHPLRYEHTKNVSTLLRQITCQLECIITPHIEQYRWADKRLNIRPVGKRKLY
jgi:KDO2-lipid IV(A) lauroyltransferase